MAEPGRLGTARLAGSSRGLMAGPELAQGTFEIDHQVLFLKLPDKDFHSEVEGRKGAAAPVTQALLTLPQLLSRPDGQGKRVQMGVGRVRAPQGAKLAPLSHGSSHKGPWDALLVPRLRKCPLLPWGPRFLPVYSPRSATRFQSLPQQRNRPMPN